MQLLFDLNRDSGTTLVLVTHDNELAMRCDTTLKLHDGALHEQSRHDQQHSAAAS